MGSALTLISISWELARSAVSGPTPDLLGQSRPFNKMPRWFSCTLWFEMHCCTAKILGVQINLKMYVYYVIPTVDMYKGLICHIHSPVLECQPLAVWHYPTYQPRTLFCSNSTSLKTRQSLYCPHHMSALSDLCDFIHTVVPSKRALPAPLHKLTPTLSAPGSLWHHSV